MTNVVYNFAAMFQQAQSMRHTAAQLNHQAQIISEEQKSLAHNWQGQTSEAYQSWQQQWNTNCQDMIQAYNNMARVYESNTQEMLAKENGLMQIW